LPSFEAQTRSMSKLTNPNRKYILFVAFAVVTLVLDQWTKVMARSALQSLPLGSTKTVIEGFFDLRFSENTGVAFGLLQTLPGGRFILTAVALLALSLVWFYLKRTEAHHTRLHVALGLIGGGAIGNLVDRILLGKVTDFIVWRYKHHEWPAFNVADAALVIGVGLMLIDIFRPPRSSVDQEETAESEAGSA